MKMTRQGKIVWGLLAGILVLLFLMSSTDLIIKEKKTEIYPVSVIIGDTTDDYYINFRKGVDKAADEYNADVNFITLYEKGDAAEQIKLLKRELDDGAGAVVLAPLKPSECGAALEDMAIGSPLIILGGRFSGDKAVSGISQDYGEAGRILGEAIAGENAPDRPVLLLSEGLDYGYNREVYDGLTEVLSRFGFQTRLYEKYASGNTDASAEYAYPGGGEAVIAALDVQSLDSAAEILAADPAHGDAIPALYGVGSTTRILNYLDRGVVKGLVTTNQFDFGYLSIVKAVEAIERKGRREQTVLDTYYIEKENLKEARFEKILYPIE